MFNTDRGWAAGLFDGEGTVTRAKYRNRTYPRVRVKMTDEAPVRRLREVFGFGSVSGPMHNPSMGKKDKPYWTWTAQGRANVSTVQMLLGGLLSPRRQQQFDQALDGDKPRHWTD